LVGRFDADREHANLSSHLRLYVLEHSGWQRQRRALAKGSGHDRRRDCMAFSRGSTLPRMKLRRPLLIIERVRTPSAPRWPS
jgi:hypothetical protein